MKNYKKSLIGITITVFLTLFLSFNTLAEEKIVKECTSGDAQTIQARYNLELEEEGSGKYKISMKGTYKNLDDARFKIVGTGGYDGIKGNAGDIQNLSKLPEITKDNAVTFSATTTQADSGEYVLSVKVKLVKGTTDTICNYTDTLTFIDFGDSKSTEVKFNTVTNPNSKFQSTSACYHFYEGIWNESLFKGEIKKQDFENYNYKAVKNKTMDGTSIQANYDSVLSYCNQSEITEGADFKESDIVKIISNAISYVKVRTTPVNGGTKTFKEVYEEIKAAATAKGNTSATGPKKFSCAIDKLYDGSNYYTAENTQYYFDSKVEETIKATYVYNYAPNDKKTEKVEVCTRTCSEAVKVEYGPPVASKAGLCFEYKVKATSYVQCSADIIAGPPKNTASYCSPVPYCHHKDYLWDGYQAGPTEDFDSCINLCDGGKYTEKCSQKCYKEVYTNSKVKFTLGGLNSPTPEPMANSSDLQTCMDNDPHGGCYYWEGDSIRWKSKFFKDTAENSGYSKDKRTVGRWYREYFNIDDIGSVFDVNSNGIKVKISVGAYGWGHCKDICYWRTNKCKKGTYLNPGSIKSDYKENIKAYNEAVAKCKTSATCSSNVSTFSISVTYNKKDEKGKVKEVPISLPYEKGNNNTKDILQSQGKDASATSTADSPNTTIIKHDGCYKDATEKNNYLAEWGFRGTYMNNKTGEILYENPGGNAGATIEGWHFEEGKFCTPLNALSVNTKWYETYKLGKTGYTKAQIESSADYNILAKAENFGYLGWNFEVKCLYGIGKDTLGSMDYTFRSVDTSNLFPNAPNDAILDPNERETGFNWTSKATNTKNANYLVEPAKLIESIQKKAADNTEYTKSNLDYEFYLTPETLSKIRTYNKNNRYDGQWTKGTTKLESGIYVYYSNLFRGSGQILDESTEVLKKGTPGINNEGE